MDAPMIGVSTWKSVTLPLKLKLQFWAAVFMCIRNRAMHKKNIFCIFSFYVQQEKKFMLELW